MSKRWQSRAGASMWTMSWPQARWTHCLRRQHRLSSWQPEFHRRNDWWHYSYKTSIVGSKCSLYCRVDNPCKPEPSCHGHIGYLTHDNRVSQRFADSHIMVKSHHAQEHTLCCPHAQAKKYLHLTARKGDGLSFWEEVHQYGRNGGGSVADVQEGEVPKEEVHRSVKMGVQDAN